MLLQEIYLTNFRNYKELSITDFEKVNVLVGENGSGKTNLLDAINFLSLTKSAFASADNYAIRHNEKFFSIKGKFVDEKNISEIFCSVQQGSKKIFREGVNEYQKLSDHIGKYPVVLIAPDDTELVKEGSEDRRKFFDSIISQLDKTYLENLIRYTYGLKQRNGLLKLFGETNSFDPIALESYDNVLTESGNILYEKRRHFLFEFLPVFKKYYHFIADRETAEIEYSTDLTRTSFREGLKTSLSRDLAMQRTNFGVHRDDYLFLLNHAELKKFGSQGQQKSFLLALKLSQFEIVKRTKKIKPILLLDDIFDKLDDSRIARLLELIRNQEFGQLFITDARPDRTAALLKQINVEAKIYLVDSGEITPTP